MARRIFTTPIGCALLMFSVWGLLHAEPSPPPQAKKPNIIWIVIDALRADHLGCYGYKRPASQFIFINIRRINRSKILYIRQINGFCATRNFFGNGFRVFIIEKMDQLFDIFDDL